MVKFSRPKVLTHSVLIMIFFFFVVDDKDSLPFELLSGESVEQNTLGKEAWVMLTNFRLFVCHGKSYYNVRYF